MIVYACHIRAISSLILESPPTWMTTVEWVWAQKTNLAISKVITWIENGKLSAAKVSEKMSQEVNQNLRQKGTAVLERRSPLLMRKPGSKEKHNELHLVVPLSYKLEVMHWAHNDVDHLGLDHMLDILHNRFYWPKMEVGATCHVHHCEWCLRFKGKQVKAELCPTFGDLSSGASPYGLLDNRKSHTSADMNVLVITDHFI